MSRWVEETFGGLPSAYWTLWAGTLVNRLGQFVVPFLGIYLTGPLGLPVEVTGAIVSLYGLGSLLAGLVGGVLADRLGRRQTMLLALVGGAAAMVGLAFARHPVAIAPLIFLVAFLSDMVRPAVQAMIADVVPAADRLRAFTLLYWAVNIGFSVAPVVAGVMARWSYLALFLGDAATTLAYAALVYARLPESHAPPAAERARSALAGLGVVVRDRAYVAFTAVGLIVVFVFVQSHLTMSIDMMAHGNSPSTYGLVLALNGVLIVVVSPWTARRLGSVARLPALAVGAVLVGAGFSVYAFGGGPAVYAGGVVLWTLGEIISSTVGAAVVADRAPADARGRYQGFYTMTWGLGAFVGPTLGGIGYRMLGPTGLWLACGGLGLCAAAGYLLLGKALRSSPTA